MKIIIAGAGEVGRHLAKMLSRENHNIVVLDTNEEVLSNLDANYDLLTFNGSPTSIESLKGAGVNSADLFIAVTPEESRNLTSCMLAAKLGAKKTVARINNPEYQQPEHKTFFEQLGIHSLIYPEQLAAKEIVNSLKRPWARQWHEFCESRLILVGVKVRKGAQIIERTLAEIFRDETDFRIAAIKRENKTLIPTGKDTVNPEDIVYFITLPSAVESIRKLCGKISDDIKNVIFMGGSRISVKSANLLKDLYNKKLIEIDKNRVEWLSDNLNPETMIIVGDGRDVELLKFEGIEKTDAFVALTENSETNILACLAAKRFNIRRTIAEVENIDYISLADGLDIGMIINKKIIAASHIYQMMLAADVTSIKSLTFAEAEVAEFVVNKKSKITKAPVKELKLPEYISLGGLVRKGKAILIYGDTIIEEGDHVVVFCPNSTINKVEKYFK